MSRTLPEATNSRPGISRSRPRYSSWVAMVSPGGSPGAGREYGAARAARQRAALQWRACTTHAGAAGARARGGPARRVRRARFEVDRPARAGVRRPRPGPHAHRRRCPTADDVRAAARRWRRHACGRCGERRGGGRRAARGGPRSARGPALARAAAVGESGTLARLATRAARPRAPPGGAIRSRPRGTLLRRVEPAAVRGAARRRGRARGLGLARWPDADPRRPPPSALRLVDPVLEPGGQRAAAGPGGLAGRDARLEVAGAIPARPYVDMTVALLARFGAHDPRRSRRALAASSPCADRCARRGRSRSTVEPDASAAAVALAAGCLSGGRGPRPRAGQRLAPGRRRASSSTCAPSAAARARARDRAAGRRSARAAAPARPEGEPDLAPVLATVAAAAALRAPGGSGAQRAARAGHAARQGELAHRGAGRRPPGLRLRRRGRSRSPGHRTAAASRGSTPACSTPRATTAWPSPSPCWALVRPGVLVADPGCVGKSWPGFWEALGALGAESAARLAGDRPAQRLHRRVLDLLEEQLQVRVGDLDAGRVQPELGRLEAGERGRGSPCRGRRPTRGG